MLGDDLEKLWPLIYDGQSRLGDRSTTRSSCCCMGGYSLPHAMMMMIPEAWAGNPLMDDERGARSTNTTPR